MPKIYLSDLVKAPAQRCFDLSRSIDLHMRSTAQTKEVAIAGRTSGLICKGETVTWEATHFFIRQQLTVVIEEMESPTYFTDRMVKGAFKSFYHQHCFDPDRGPEENYTTMTELFTYEVPYGILGKIFDKFVLKRYMTRFLVARFKMIKHFAESEEWRKILE